MCVSRLQADCTGGDLWLLSVGGALNPLKQGSDGKREGESAKRKKVDERWMMRGRTLLELKPLHRNTAASGRHIHRDPTQPTELLPTGGCIFKTTVTFGVI